MIDNIMEFFPHVVNDVEELERLIVLRVPPASKTDANAGISDGEELLEQFANIQVSFQTWPRGSCFFYALQFQI